MFSEMIIHNDINYAKDAIKKMNQKLGVMTMQQQVCADIVFSSFIASLKNYENITSGKIEEMHLFKMKESCEIGEKND